MPIQGLLTNSTSNYSWMCHHGCRDQEFKKRERTLQLEHRTTIKERLQIISGVLYSAIICFICKQSLSWWTLNATSSIHQHTSMSEFNNNFINENNFSYSLIIHSFQGMVIHSGNRRQKKKSRIFFFLKEKRKKKDNQLQLLHCSLEKAALKQKYEDSLKKESACRTYLAVIVSLPTSTAPHTFWYVSSRKHAPHSIQLSI